MRFHQQVRDHRRGVAAVEMAMVLPVFVLIFLGVIEVARLGMVVQLMTTAAREGCRTAVLPDTTASDVQTHIEDVLTGSGISTPTIDIQPSGWETASQGTAISVTLTLPYKNVSWLSGSTFLSGSNITTAAAFCSEKP